MTTLARPNIRPANPCFSSGPCAKRPAGRWLRWGALLGRSHRSKPGKAKLQEVIERSRAILGLPADWRLGIVPASDTGAIEMAMWSLLGARGIDILAWESFGEQWVTDVTKQLKLADIRVLKADYGRLPDLAQVNGNRDIVFTWNGTTSGVAVPNGDWIAGRSRRLGDLRRDLGGVRLRAAVGQARRRHLVVAEGAGRRGAARHAGPLAARRGQARELHPPWPMPKLFRMTKGGKLVEGIFAGDTINTPSMLAVEDALDGLRWAEAIGGLPALIRRAEANLAAIEAWVAATPWVDFLAGSPHAVAHVGVPEDRRSRLSVVAGRPAGRLWRSAWPACWSRRTPATTLAPTGRAARPRLWAGSVETADLQALFPWLDWAWASVEAELPTS